MQAEAAAAPTLAVQAEAGSARVRLQGVWTAAVLAHPQYLEALSVALQQVASRGGTPAWDLRGIERLDHVGAQWVWNAWGRHWPEQLQCDERQRAMLERVARFTQPAPRPPRRGLRERFFLLGEWLMGIESHLEGALRL